jgi:hypothetical protein
MVGKLEIPFRRNDWQRPYQPAVYAAVLIRRSGHIADPLDFIDYNRSDARANKCISAVLVIQKDAKPNR